MDTGYQQYDTTPGSSVALETMEVFEAQLAGYRGSEQLKTFINL